MNCCTLFRLNIWRTGQDCTFLLTWGEGQQISAHLKYSPELDRLYRDWLLAYQNAYDSPSKGRAEGPIRAEEPIAFTPASIDWKNKSEEAKEAFLQKFQQWLGDAELLTIRERLQQEVGFQRKEKKQKRGHGNCVNLLIACNCPELTKLPWEAWEISPKKAASIHISRTPLNVENEAIADEQTLSPGKVRILVVLANTSELDVAQDGKAVQSLSKVAQVKRLEFKSGQNGDAFKEQFRQQLVDERGWNVLIFAGHSDETEFTGGKLNLAPGVTLSISEIEPELTFAKSKGLQVAIFNSCRGLCIAERLIQLGLSQVVVMREKIHDSVAHIFLKQFCQNLAAYHDIQAAMLAACNYLKQEKHAYPSACLIPSLFLHPSPDVKLFVIEPSRWKRIWRDWQLTRAETIALSILVFLSLVTPINGELFNLRIGIQAIYRDKTGQIPKQKLPPVRLIAIDQESLNAVTLDTYKVNPIDRSYLAQLIQHVSQSTTKVIGVDYLLDGSTREDEILTSTLRKAVEQKNTWFIFANEEYEPGVHVGVSKTIASPKWSLHGEITITHSPFWELILPSQESCLDNCPFAYVLALVKTLNQHRLTETSPQPRLDNSTHFQNQVSARHKNIVPVKVKTLPLGLQPIIDFSIPLNQVYNRISAWQFLELPPDATEWQSIAQQIVLIAPGGYDRADDNFPIPWAIRYWRSRLSRGSQTDSYPKWFTGGEAHAYMIHHILSQHYVVLVPTFWLVLVAAILGKGTNLILFTLSRKQLPISVVVLISLTVAYWLIGLQLYISTSVLLPGFFPSLTFWNFIVLSMRRKLYA